MHPHLFVDDRPPAMHVAQLGDLGGAIGASASSSTNNESATSSAHAQAHSASLGCRRFTSR